MRKHMVIGVMIVVLIATIGLLTACGGSSSSQPTTAPSQDGAMLLEERCTTCHGLDRTTQAQKTRAEWEQTVGRMIDKGAELSTEEKVVLVDHLAETYGP